MIISLLVKNALQHICLVLPLLPLLFVNLSKMFSKMKDNQQKGKKDFQVVKEITEKNRSPTPKYILSRKEIIRLNLNLLDI